MAQERLTGHIDSTRFQFLPPKSWKLEITGWILHPTRPITELSAAFGQHAGEIQRQQRADVNKMLPNILHSGEWGFKCSFDLPHVYGLDHELKLTAKLESGECISTTVPIDLRAVRFEGEVRADSKALYGDEEARRSFNLKSKNLFEAFLRTEQNLTFQKHPSPKVSVIIVLFNQAELTYNCLKSLSHSKGVELELIIVDNCSTDRTATLLSRTSGAHIIQNKVNKHFLAGANQGASVARGEYLLFLNNDAEVLEDTIANAALAMATNTSIGALGARIIRPDGFLQEAGCYILRDGSTFGFGVGDDPFSTRYSNKRVVDYCSGAFLLTRETTFRGLAGFDEAFSPAYFEDVDYCLRLSKAGLKTMYDPSVTVFHSEKSSSENRTTAEYLTDKNRLQIRRNHRDILIKKPFPPIRFGTSTTGRKILIIDNAFPDSKEGQGFPRAELLLSEIIKMGFEVTFLALNQTTPPVLPGAHSNIHFVAIGDDLDFEIALGKHAHGAKIILVSRSPNMERFSHIYPFVAAIDDDTPIIFDAEALFANRAILEASVLEGLELSATEIRDIISKEVKLTEDADLVLTVSKPEANTFLEHGAKNVHVVSHVAHLRDEVPGFENRQGLLMVGPILNAKTPNADGFKWFLEKVLPLIRAKLPLPLQLQHAGKFELSEREFPAGSFQSYGMVENLSALYDSNRVFIAPIRFGAGIPIKVVEAVSNGIPVVATKLLATQLEWNDGEELLIGESPDDFAAACVRLYSDQSLWERIQTKAKDRVLREYHKGRFEESLRQAFKTLKIQ